ncbi:MAG: hypothetical protein PUB49_08405 [Selenomonadaceae bacterium]|nr:hypothetical protein [Selenomonadaceae bacterium]
MSFTSMGKAEVQRRLGIIGRFFPLRRCWAWIIRRSPRGRQDEGLKKAYEEMLTGCIAHPEQWGWYAMWMIERRDGEHVGDLCFKGLSEEGVAEIGYGIEEECRITTCLG